jgi:chemotaxis family two-component system sensor kinase Cph1
VDDVTSDSERAPETKGWERLASDVDLATCDREPIHIPGAIQPHGALLAVAEDDLTILQGSANVVDLLGRPVEEVLGNGLADVLDAASLERIREACASPSLGHVNPVSVVAAGRTFDAVLHRTGGLLVVELEPRIGGEREELRGFAEAREALARLQGARTREDLWRAAAEEVRRITGFHRVMVYRFDERDEHGEVVAESLDPAAGCEAYLGLHYPASDVPAQARALYVLQWLRLITDVGYRPSPVLPAVSPRTGEPLDMSHAVLRSVSPIHVEYLRNMGVSASMSISMVRDRRLWGLIACHHLAPRLVPFRTRLVCEIVAQVCSSLLDPLERAEAAGHRARTGAVHAALVTRLAREEDVHGGLLAGDPSLLDLVEAGGVAIAHDGRVETRGDTPSLEQIAAVIEHLRERATGGVHATDALPSEMPGAEGLAPHGSGLLAFPLSRARSEYVLWFRPEWVRTVRWGGDPSEAAAVDPRDQRVSPRRSFAAWEQTVVGKARPWAPWEIAAAGELRAGLAGVLLEKAGKIAVLNANLEAAVRSRDDFLSVASHELRTPVTTLGLLLESLRRALDRGQVPADRVLGRLDVALKQVQRLNHLMGELLDVSRITAGRLSLDVTEVDLVAVARAVVERFEQAASASGIQITLCADAPVRGRWDELRVDQVLTNLLSNALKYGLGQPVHVRVAVEGGRAVVRVEDRGAGVPEDALERIFERFERASGAGKATPGLGLGLWIVRQLVERHGGDVRVDSRPGHGSTFTVTLPLEAPA